MNWDDTKRHLESWSYGDLTDTVPVDFADQYNLYRAVLKRRPQIVLELGMGLSTFTFLSAMHEVGTGILVSVEDSEAWAHNTLASIYDDFKCRLVPLITPLKTYDSDPRLVSYENVPSMGYDMVYIDGPDLIDKPYDITYLPLGGSIDPGVVMIIDGRKATFKYYKDEYDPFVVKHNGDQRILVW